MALSEVDLAKQDSDALAARLARRKKLGKPISKADEHNAAVALKRYEKLSGKGASNGS